MKNNFRYVKYFNAMYHKIMKLLIQIAYLLKMSPWTKITIMKLYHFKRENWFSFLQGFLKVILFDIIYSSLKMMIFEKYTRDDPYVLLFYYSTNFKCGLHLERGPPNLVRTIGYLLDWEIDDLIKKFDINRLDGT